MLKDLKEAMTTNRKPDITQVRKHFMGYTSRTAEYGNDKYERANYLRPTGDGPHTEPTGADFKRLRVYARAAMAHLGDMLQMMELHQAGDPNLLDVEGMKRAAYAMDIDETPGNPVGPSRLPHIAPACTSLMMAIEQAVACGLLPADPGTPWKSNTSAISEAGDPGYRAAVPGTLHTPLTEANYTSYARVSVTRPPTFQAGGDPGDEQPGKGPWAVEPRAVTFPAGSFGPVTVTLMKHEPGATWEDAARAHAERDDRVDALALAMREINERATATMPSDCVGAKIMERVWRFDTSDVAPLRAAEPQMHGELLYSGQVMRAIKNGELLTAADFVPHGVDLARDQVEALPDGTPIRVMWLGTEKWQSEAYGAPLVKGTSNVGVVCARAQHGDRFELIGTLATINPEGLRVRLADQKAQGV